MTEHRWTIPCELSPDEAQLELAKPLERLREEQGFEVIEHIETVGFFGWTLRSEDERAVGISVPQPGSPSQLMIRTEHPELGDLVVDALQEADAIEDGQVEPTDPDRDLDPDEGDP